MHLRVMESTDVPFADSLGALAGLQRAGKIRHIGLSNVTLEQIQAAQRTTRIASVQNLYNLIDRRDEAVVDYCTDQGIPFMPYFPLAVGNLGNETGPLTPMAQRHQATPAQIALAWLLARSPQVVLIPGTSTVAHLEENIAAAAIQLGEEEYRELAENPDIAALPSFRA